MRVRVYIAGPMTGYENFNREAFHKAEEELKREGHTVLNPAVLPDGLTQPHYMDICMAMIRCVDAIYMLNGWQRSAGAKAELALAEKLGHPALVCSADDEAGYFQGRHDCNAFFYRLGDGRDLRKRFYNVAWFWKLNPLELRRTAISHFADLEAEAVRINEEMKHG